MATINDNVKKFRIELGMTQKDLAFALGYRSPSTIAKIESGENAVDIQTAYQLAQIFHVSPSMLAGWTNDEKQEESLMFDFRGLNRKWKQYIMMQITIAKNEQEREDLEELEYKQAMSDDFEDEADE